MAITVGFVRSTPMKLTYRITGDNASTSATITNATLQSNATGGPLLNALNASYANQAAMQSVFGQGSIRMMLRPITGALPGGVDVDTDAVTPAKPEVNLVVVAGTTSAYLDIEYVHSHVA